MQFLYPQILFGFFAVTIPIAIHLFNLQKPKKVYFTNTALLRNIQDLNKKKVQIKNLLILLSRVLFIIFLVLAFAQPFFKGAATLNEQGFIRIYIDNSMSMQVESGNERLLDKAVKEASALIDNLPSSNYYHIYDNDFSFSGKGLLNNSDAKDALTEIGFSGIHKSFQEVAGKKYNVNRPFSNQSVYYFSDFQKSTLGNIENSFSDTSSQINLIQLAPPDVSNIFVDSVWFSNLYVRSNEVNNLKVLLQNSGSEEKQDVLIKLFINKIQVASTTIILPSNAGKVIDFNFTITEPGTKLCEIVIEEFPVTFDNEYFFSFAPLDSIRILEINENPKSINYLKNVYESENIFQYNTVRSNNVNYTNFESNHLVIVNGVNSIAPSLIDKIKLFVDNGGSILIFPDEKPNIEKLSQLVQETGVVLIANEPDTNRLNIQILPPDFSNPFFSGIFEEKRTNIQMPEEKSNISWNKAGNLLLNYKNDKPFLSWIKRKSGNIFLSARSLDNENKFARHGLFLPILYKIAFLSKRNNNNLCYSFGDKLIAYPTRNPSKNTLFKLKKGDFEIIPHQKFLGKSVIFEIPGASVEPGHYRVLEGNVETGYLSFNYDKKESDLNIYSSEELKAKFNGSRNIKIFDLESGDNITRETKEISSGISLWKYCLIIALMFLLVEVILLRVFKNI
jgi:hypothetical protein